MCIRDRSRTATRAVSFDMNATELRLRAELLAEELALADPHLEAEERRGAAEYLAALAGWDQALLLEAAGPVSRDDLDEGRRLLLAAALATVTEQ